MKKYICTKCKNKTKELISNLDKRIFDVCYECYLILKQDKEEKRDGK